MKDLMPSKTFSQKVWKLAKKIPKGKVTTYKILAQKLNTKAYRLVGQALRCNPYSPVVPCHRVVKSDGFIGGYKGIKNANSKEIKEKIKMLEKEGIKIKDNRIADFDKVLFEF